MISNKMNFNRIERCKRCSNTKLIAEKKESEQGRRIKRTNCSYEQINLLGQWS